MSPTDTAHHPGHDGAFEVFTVENKGRTIYLETIRSGTSWHDPDAVEDSKKVFGELRGAAPPEGASRGIFKTISGESPMSMSDWFTSSYSQGMSNCLEARHTRVATAAVHIRDTRHRHLGHLTFDRAEWAAFLHAAARKEL